MTPRFTVKVTAGHQRSHVHVHSDLQSESFYVRIQRGGGGGDRGSGPPFGKSQVIWISIEINIWTPLLGKSWTPSGSLEKYSFLCNKTIGPPL